MSNWTDERVAYLRRRWIAGQSGRKIAKALGVTTNAVMGKVHRTKLFLTHPHGGALSSTGRAARVKQHAAQARPASAKAATPPSAKPRNRRDERSYERVVNVSAPLPPAEPVRAHAFDPLPGVKPLPLMQRRANQCAWPVGEPPRPAEQLCCGAPVASVQDCATPYCLEHGKLRRGAPRPPIGRVA